MVKEKFPPVLVDREKEIAILKKAMEDCKAGRGSTVLITGDIGTGKTRLAEEFAEICEKEGFVVLSSMCLGGNEPPYLPVLIALENYAKRAKKEEAYLPLGLAGFQPLEIEERTPESVTKERTRMLEYLLQQFVGIAKKQPVLFIIDDLHLADSATLAFFHYLSRNIRKERIVATATYLEEYTTTETPFAKTLRNIHIERVATQIKLENLDEKGVQAIAEQLGFPQPAEIANYIYERTSGNPFFVVEFLNAIKSTGAIEIEEIKKMALPNTVKEAVKFLLSRLDEKTRRVFSVCAVLGKVFEYKVLLEVVELGEEELLDAIESLLALHFLFETEEVEEGYKFGNNTIQEVVYEELSTAGRRLIHLKAAEVLEKYHGADEKFWNSLAYHYREGGNKTKFFEYAVKAGRKAAKKFANAEAAALFKEVLEVLGEGTEELLQKIEILWELAEVLELEGKYEEALELLSKRVASTLSEKPVEAGKSHRKMAEIYTTKGDYENALVHTEKAEQLLLGKPEGKLELARVWNTKAHVYERKGDFKGGIEWQGRALEVFEAMHEEKDAANALHRIGTCYAYLGEYQKALFNLERAIKIRESINDLRGVAGGYNNIGIIYDYKGEYDKALEFYHKGLAIYERIGDVAGLAIVYNNIGVIYDRKGEFDKALEFYQKSLSIKERIGDLRGMAFSYDNIGMIYKMKGEYEKALEYHLKSLDLEEQIGDLWGIAISYNSIGEIYHQKGEYEKAQEFYQKSLDTKEKIGDTHGLVASLTLLGSLFLELGEPQNALECYTRAFEVAKQVGAKAEEFTAMLGLAEVYVEMGELEKAFQFLEEGKGSALIFGERDVVAYAKYVEGKFYAAKQEKEKAVDALKHSVAIYESMGRRDYYYHRAFYELGKIAGDKELLAKAFGFFGRIGNRSWAEKIRVEMNKIESKEKV